MRIHLLESAQRSIHRFFDSSTKETDVEIRKELTQIALRIAQLRKLLTKQKETIH